MASDDPDFETKAADIIGLYLNPPKHAAVFCVDEKSHIQALDRLDPVLPLSPGRLERHGFEYFRHGTLSLYAALDTLSGEVYGKTVARHTSDELVSFLKELLAAQPRGRQIHVILDNLSAHKSAKVRSFLDATPRITLHFTPTYSSWLNQVEIWFAKIERDVIARGVFTSKADLSRKIMRYIRRYNRNARPIRWSYSDPAKRIQPASASSLTSHSAAVGRIAERAQQQRHVVVLARVDDLEDDRRPRVEAGPAPAREVGAGVEASAGRCPPRGGPGRRSRTRPSASVTPRPSALQVPSAVLRSSTAGTPAPARPSAVSRTWVVIGLMRPSSWGEQLLEAQPRDLGLLVGGDPELVPRVVGRGARAAGRASRRRSCRWRTR